MIFFLLAGINKPKYFSFPERSHLVLKSYAKHYTVKFISHPKILSPLSSWKKRQWFLERLHPNTTAPFPLGGSVGLWKELICEPNHLLQQLAGAPRAAISLPLSEVTANSYPNHNHREDWTPLEYLIIFEDQTQRERIDSKFMILSAGLNFSKFSMTWWKTTIHGVWCEIIIFHLCFQQRVGSKWSSVLSGWNPFRFSWRPFVDSWRFVYCTCFIPTYYLIEWNGRMCFFQMSKTTLEITMES